jgi:phage baseplate assembly protein W
LDKNFGRSGLNPAHGCNLPRLTAHVVKQATRMSRPSAVAQPHVVVTTHQPRVVVRPLAVARSARCEISVRVSTYGEQGTCQWDGGSGGLPEQGRNMEVAEKA